MATMGLAAGYQNLPSGNWVPAVYSQKVQKFSDVHQLLKILLTLITLEKSKILATR